MLICESPNSYLFTSHRSMLNPVKGPGIVYNLASTRLKDALGIAKTDVSGTDEALKVC